MCERASVCVQWFHMSDPILCSWMWLLHHTVQFAEPVAHHIWSNDIVKEGGGDGGGLWKTLKSLMINAITEALQTCVQLEPYE